MTFLPNDTTLDDFVHDGSPARGEALLAWEQRSYMGGFVKVALEHAGVELVGIESPLWPRTGTGSGWITTEAYEHFLGRMLAELEEGGRWHGVYLPLHGAMGVGQRLEPYRAEERLLRLDQQDRLPGTSRSRSSIPTATSAFLE